MDRLYIVVVGAGIGGLGSALALAGQAIPETAVGRFDEELLAHRAAHPRRG